LINSVLYEKMLNKTFSNYLIYKWADEKEYTPYEPPIHGNDSFLVAISPSDLNHQQSDLPGKLKKPVHPKIHEMLHNINPTTQTMFVF
jgi:hypothetical protein